MWQMLIPEGIGLAAGIGDWAMGALGYDENNTVRQYLDALDKMSIINNLAEGFGIAPTIENKGAVPSAIGAATSFVPFFTGGYSKGGELIGRALPKAMQGSAANTVAAFGLMAAPSAAGALRGGGGMRPNYGQDWQTGNRQDGSTYRGQSPGGGFTYDSLYAMPTAVATSTAETLRRAAENYPAMWERAQIMQNIRDAANYRAMNEAQNRILGEASQAFSVPAGPYPFY